MSLPFSAWANLPEVDSEADYYEENIDEVCCPDLPEGGGAVFDPRVARSVFDTVRHGNACRNRAVYSRRRRVWRPPVRRRIATVLRAAPCPSQLRDCQHPVSQPCEPRREPVQAIAPPPLSPSPPTVVAKPEPIDLRPPRRQPPRLRRGSAGTDDPNQDALFIFPTGKTLEQDQVSVGFPGQGIPDIQYGVTDWLQAGIGYGLVGLTPNLRLGLIRNPGVDVSVIYGSVLPISSPRPFTAHYAGGVISAGSDAFHVHLGYFWTRMSGKPFPDADVHTEGGFGYTGLDLKLAPRAKFLLMLMSWSEKDDNLFQANDPVQIYAAAPGLRFWGKNVALDVGVATASITGGDRTKPETAILPLLTLRSRF